MRKHIPLPTHPRMQWQDTISSHQGGDQIIPRYRTPLIARRFVAVIDRFTPSISPFMRSSLHAVKLETLLQY